MADLRPFRGLLVLPRDPFDATPAPPCNISSTGPSFFHPRGKDETPIEETRREAKSTVAVDQQNPTGDNDGAKNDHTATLLAGTLPTLTTRWALRKETLVTTPEGNSKETTEREQARAGATTEGTALRKPCGNVVVQRREAFGQP